MSEYRVIDSFGIAEDLRIKAIKTESSSIWYVQYNLPGSGPNRQRRKSLKTKSKKEAMLRGLAFARDLDGGQHRDPRRNRITVDEVTAMKLARTRERGRSPATVEIYRRHYATLTAFLPDKGRTRVSELTVSRLEAFERALATTGVFVPKTEGASELRRVTRPLSSKTIHELMKCVMGLIRFARERDLVDRNPAAGYSIPPDSSDEVEVFSAEEIQRIFADPELGDAWKVILFCALRIEEFCWLTWDDVVYDDQMSPYAIRIRPKTCPFSGLKWVPKHRVERTIPLVPEAAEVIFRLPHAGHWIFASKAKSAKPFGGRWPSALLRGAFHRRRLKAKILHGHPHVLRHTFASYLANCGQMGIPMLQRFLGHSDLASTSGYLHARPDDIAAVVGRLDCGRLIAAPATTIVASEK